MSDSIILDQQAISSIIRVRPPYLWLDDVIELSDEAIVARKYLDPQLELFQAHFVDYAVFPGALQCEAAFQAASVLIAQTQPVQPDRIPVIGRVRRVKFQQLVRPADQLRVEVKLLDRTESAMRLRGKVFANGNVSTQLEFLATEAKRPQS